MSERIEKIVLAYSGGLDTSVILSWLKETYQCPVVAYAADLGQGDELEDIRKKALETGAEEVIVEDVKETFVRDYVWPAMRANAVYETHYLLGTSLARPLIAKGQVNAARSLGADALSYGESERMFLVEIIGEIPLVSHEKHEDRGEAGAAGIHILHTDVLEFE